MPRQALPNGAPTSSKPSSPALIETKEPNGSAHASGSTSEEAEEQEQVSGDQGRHGEQQQVAIGELNAGRRGGYWPLAQVVPFQQYIYS